MLIAIPDVLSKTEVARCRKDMDAAEWIDGKVTAGEQSGSVKKNQQLPEGSEVARNVGALILERLSTHPTFISAALPQQIFPPLFNKYEGGEHFGTHVDNAIRGIPGTGQCIRTDLSCTLFFSEPEDYEGGELVIEDNYGTQEVKLPAGSMVLYPSTSLHHVNPVTKGARVSSFFWMQSMIRDNESRALLFDMDQSIQSLTEANGLKDPNVVKLTGIYHNLVRKWAETS